MEPLQKPTHLPKTTDSGCSLDRPLRILQAESSEFGHHKAVKGSIIWEQGTQALLH